MFVGAPVGVPAATVAEEPLLAGLAATEGRACGGALVDVVAPANGGRTGADGGGGGFGTVTSVAATVVRVVGAVGTEGVITGVTGVTGSGGAAWALVAATVTAAEGPTLVVVGAGVLEGPPASR